MLRPMLRHPALHILLLGVLVAAAILIARGPATGDEDRRVIVTGTDLLQLQAAFHRTWQREPTAAELRRQLDEHIRQEVLYREALQRGYDRDDPLVRQAMQRKMEFLASSQAMREAPSDKEVQAFFALQQERYRLPAVVDFAQVYVSPDARGAAADQAATALLERLRRENPEPRQLLEWGDPIMLDPLYRRQTQQDVDSVFGKDFTASVLEAEVGIWVGPLSSGYGLHLVKVLVRQDSRIPELAEVSRRVLSDMEYEAGRAAKEQLYQEIVQTYQIVLDRPVRDLLTAAGE